MKKTLSKIFCALCVIVLIAKISNWFFNYSNETNEIINTAMFSLIGITYLIIGFVWGNKLITVIFMFCGIYLIGMNFIGDFLLKDILGIICLLTPLLTGVFTPDEKKSTEN